MREDKISLEMTEQEKEGAGARVLFLRFGAIGNALAAVPAIRAVRAAWPKAFLALAGDPLTLELLRPCPYLDELIRYDSRGPEAAGPGYVRFIWELRRRRFTHVIHFRRYLRSELIGWFSGAPVRIGFRTEARLQFLTEKIQYEEGENVIELNLRLVGALEIPASDRRLEYWPSENAGRVEEVLATPGEGGPLVVLHPGAATQKERRWEGFGELAQELRRRLEARVVLIAGEAERALVEEIAASLQPPLLTAVGWPLPELAALLARADLFAGIDSGPAHLAAAVGIRGAVIYAPHFRLALQLKKWKPEGPHWLAFTPARDCADCSSYPCPLPRQRECANTIPVSEVADGLGRLYAMRRGKKA